MIAIDVDVDPADTAIDVWRLPVEGDREVRDCIVRRGSIGCVCTVRIMMGGRRLLSQRIDDAMKPGVVVRPTEEGGHVHHLIRADVSLQCIVADRIHLCAEALAHEQLEEGENICPPALGALVRLQSIQDLDDIALKLLASRMLSVRA